MTRVIWYLQRKKLDLMTETRTGYDLSPPPTAPFSKQSCNQISCKPTSNEQFKEEVPKVVLGLWDHAKSLQWHGLRLLWCPAAPPAPRGLSTYLVATLAPRKSGRPTAPFAAKMVQGKHFWFLHENLMPQVDVEALGCLWHYDCCSAIGIAAAP